MHQQDEAAQQQDEAAQHRWTLVLLALLCSGSLAILAILFLGPDGGALVAVLGLLVAYVFGMATLLTRRNVREAVLTISKAQRAWFTLAVLALSVALFGLQYLLVQIYKEPIPPAHPSASSNTSPG